MKTLVIGDLHGQVEIVSKALDTEFPLIFLGDYLDSFDRTTEDQITTLELVMEAVDRGRARALRGNHEISYLNDNMRCSGYNSATQASVNILHSKMASRLKDFLWAEKFLISHAGVSQMLLDCSGITLNEYLATSDYLEVGRARGGACEIGGLYWCDWEHEFTPIKGIAQIVGHTRAENIRQKGNSYCIDCLEDDRPKGLLIEDGNATPFNL